MRKYRLYQIDAFTRARLSGNPAGVVPDARGLSEEEMLAVARELNDSETAFILPGGDGYDIEARFFTPLREVPLCGHATVAAHWARAKELGLPACRVVQKTKAGLLPVDLVPEDDGYAVTMTQAQPEVAPPLDPALTERVCAALGISPDCLRDDCPVCVASTGVGKVMLALRDPRLLNELSPDMNALSALTPQTGGSGYYVFSLHPGEAALARGRMFNPASGVPEDPVTGVANGALGAYLVRFGLFQDGVTGEFSFTAVQGEAIRRPGTVDVRVEVAGGLPRAVRITGRAVAAFSAEIELD